MESVLKIRNQDEVRKASINNKIITWDEHKKWFKSKLNSPNVLMLILEYENRPAGLVRLERKEDEVVVQRDNGNATEEVWDVCEKFESKMAFEYNHCSAALNKNFAAYKNTLNKQCKGDWIFQIDADEIPNEYLIEALPFILEANEDTETFWASRPPH